MLVQGQVLTPEEDTLHWTSSAIINSMDQSPSWEADIHSASQKNFRPYYGNQRFVTLFTRAHQWIPSWDPWVRLHHHTLSL